MCGRYVQTKAIERYMRPLVIEWHRAQADVVRPTWNLAPSRLSWIVRLVDAAAEPAALTWGLRRALDAAGPAPVNARVESAESSRAFGSSWRERRCVVPADGWYEWRLEEGRKQPYFFARADEEPVYFAGLWAVGTFCFFTTAADGALAQVHHRKPLALAPPDALAWLKRPLATSELVRAAVAAPAFRFHAVDQAVSNWRNDGPGLIAPRGKPLQGTLL